MKLQIGTITSGSSLHELVSRYLAHVSGIHCKATVATEKSATDDFLAFFGDTKISEVTTERADAWRIQMLADHAQNTARTRLCLLKGMFRYAITIGIITVDPLKGIKIPAMIFKGRIIGDRLLRLFLNEFPLPMRRVMRLILYTGMRKSEAVLLDWSEVKHGKIVLPPERTKNRKGRTIYLNAAARRCLGPRRTGRVFRYSPSYYNKFSTAAWRKLKLGRFRIHDLRHVAAARYSERNRDDSAMLRTFGWANEESARPYRHITNLRDKQNMSRVSYAI